MNNILTTVPISKFKDWKSAERAFIRSDGSTKYRFWLVNATRPPAKDLIGSVCYVIYAGKIRGYFDIVDIKPVAEWDHHNNAIEQNRTGVSLIMANWHSVANGEDMTGFQGWRYTQLRP